MIIIFTLKSKSNISRKIETRSVTEYSMLMKRLISSGENENIFRDITQR
jgi:hypothetical protein